MMEAKEEAWRNAERVESLEARVQELVHEVEVGITEGDRSSESFVPSEQDLPGHADWLAQATRRLCGLPQQRTRPSLAPHHKLRRIVRRSPWSA